VPRHFNFLTFHYVSSQIMKEYKNEIDDILVSNKQLASELHFELRQFEKGEAAKLQLQRQPSASSPAAMVPGGRPREPEGASRSDRRLSTPLSIPRLNSASKAPADGDAGPARLRSCAAGIRPRALSLQEPGDGGRASNSGDGEMGGAPAGSGEGQPASRKQGGKGCAGGEPATKAQVSRQGSKRDTGSREKAAPREEAGRRTRCRA
jgi:hypothetical protein